MKTWIDELIDDYYKFLRDRTIAITDTGTDWVAISTPFVGAFNDCIEIYAKKAFDKIILSDDGATLRNLDLQGVPITHSTSTKRKMFLESILRTYGISRDGDEFIVDATEANFAQKKHNLIMAISDVNDMYMLSRPLDTSIFKEDVKLFLDEHNIVYTPQFISKGRTGLEFTFDFQIAYKNKEIVVKSYESLNTTNVPNFLFTWDDVKSVREQISNKSIVGLAFVNDAESGVKPEYIDALKSRNAECILWSEKDSSENMQKLVA